jgi:hypothetical protein
MQSSLSYSPESQFSMTTFTIANNKIKPRMESRVAMHEQ